MAVEVRIRNFQSIEDSSIVIDGLTAITGTNNSGKTAAMRAIRGVFTNPPAGPLVRHGKAFLSVSLSFDDGTTIVWEKGWEKPGKKGKTVNRYHVNGHLIQSVGAGVPEEVENLGVREVKAASDRIWPQIAEQFDGALFLVNRPGSAIAEALSDVEKVGKLTSALKLSEKDNRSIKDKLKVRREDIATKETDLARYDGLELVGAMVSHLETQNSKLESEKSQILEFERLLSSLESAQTKVSWFSRFDPSVLPDSSSLIRVSKGVDKVSGLLSKLEVSKSTLESLSGLDSVSVPDCSTIKSQIDGFELADALNTKLSSAETKLSEYTGFSVALPDPSPVQEDLNRLRKAVSLFKSLRSANSTLSDRSKQLEEAETELGSAKTEVESLLKELGVCPTCNTVHSSNHED